MMADQQLIKRAAKQLKSRILNYNIQGTKQILSSDEFPIDFVLNV